ECRTGNGIGRLTRVVEGVLTGRAHQGQQGVERPRRVRLLESPLLPFLRILMLDGDPGGEANEAIFVAQIRPGGFNGLGVLSAVEHLELAPERVQRTGCRAALRRFGRFYADVGESVQPRLRPAPADGEV